MIRITKKYFNFLMGFGIVAVMTCGVSADSPGPYPYVATGPELERHWDEKVILVGIYREMLLPKGKRPGSPLVLSRRIIIVLPGISLALETHEAGYRSLEEKKKYMNKRVKVAGTIRRMVQLWGTPEEQAIVMPAIKEIESIELIR